MIRNKKKKEVFIPREEDREDVDDIFYFPPITDVHNRIQYHFWPYNDMPHGKIIEKKVIMPKGEESYALHYKTYFSYLLNKIFKIK